MRKKDGFSLMEIVVTSAIMLVTIAAGFGFINNYNARQEVSATYTDIISGLKMARNYAVTRQRPKNLTTEPPYVTINILNDGWSIYSGADTAMSYAAKDWSGRAVTVGGGMLRFSMLGGFLLDDSGKRIGLGDTATISISPIGSGQPLSIVINADGVIDEKK
jgi:prepilin-type N-terminal cleavage/methylation domain-containing protein